MVKFGKIFLTALLILFLKNISFAQYDSLVAHCNELMKYPYISDGQQYRALVVKGEVAEFYFTFYGDATYRLVACTGDGTIAPIFRVYDKNRTLLFSSDTYNNPFYWDFKFTSTIEAIVEAELPPEAPESGIIVLLLGFK